MSSLITSCPACRTRFKLVPDQLKVSDGWVRCGQCREIFDASSRIEQPLQPVARPVPLLTEQWPDSVMPDVPPPPPTPEPTAPPGPTPVAEQIDEADSGAEQAFTRTEVDIVVDDPGPVDTRALNFVREDEKRHFWRSWPMRAALGCAALVLTLALVAQTLIHQRDWVAAKQPGWRPLLAMLCDFAGCTLSHVKDPHSLLIDSTRFVKLTGDANFEVYRVELVIKNRADHPVASPSLELSLTDHQDRVVVRKVLPPTQYIHNEVLAPQSEQTVSTAVRVSTSQVGTRVSGYRVMLFYP
jgi:predicted Zn finger-like uncharacterized protein